MESPRMEPDKVKRDALDAPPRGSWAGMVAIHDAAPVLAVWLKGAVVVLGFQIISIIGLVWVLWAGVEQLRRLTVAVEAIPK